MVRNDVEDLSHAVRAQRGDEVFEVRRVGDLGVERVVIDYVIAVSASRACAKIRRTIDVTHPEARKIGDELGCLTQAKSAVQLQSVGGARDDRVRAAQRR